MSMHLQPATKYDPNVIIQAASDKVSKNDIPGAQMVYQAALLEWVDDAREGSTSGVDPYTVREAIATLWLSYANLNRTLGLNKSAMEAYEQAVNDPIATSVGRVWLDYARFAEERDKLRTAQNVYLRALVGDGSNPAPITDEQDQALLWAEFLEMMKKSNSALTMSELKTAVQTEHIAKMAAQADATKAQESQPEAVASSSMIPGTETTTDVPDSSSNEPPEKRARIEVMPPDITSAVPIQTQQQPPPQQQQEEESKTYVITAESVEDETKALNSLIATMPPEFSAAWLARDGDSPPLPPSPALFTASPPKLSDPTGKAILGEKLALALITMLLKKDDDDKSGSVLLDVCRGLWLMTALKEKESAKAIENLEEQMTKEMETVESRFEARLANYTGQALSSMQQVNETERDAFIQSCNQRRQQLLSMIAWDFRHLQCNQQQILTKMMVPGFQGPTVDPSALELQSRICSFLHSAFFLRSRIKEVPHLNMLKSQAERLRTSINEEPMITSPSHAVATTTPAAQAPPPLPSTTGGPPPPPLPQYAPPPHHIPPPLPVNLPPPHPAYAPPPMNAAPGQPYVPGYPGGIPPPPPPTGGQQPPPPHPQYGQQQYYR